MKHDSFLKRYISFVLAVLLFTYASGACLPVNGESAIYDKILRLHVVANSDSEEDQEMKLYVRNVLLSEIDALYRESGAVTLEAAKKVLSQNSEKLRLCAQKAIESFAPDCKYDAGIELAREYYPTREYEDITLPAGVYNSLIIKIGKAEGKNWWCVLFPTLCLASATKSEAKTDAYVYEENGEEFIAAGFTPEQIKIISDSKSDDVKIKFRVLEILGELFDPET